jgi:hypothetical protein
MATVDMSREYAVEREQLWGHLVDPANWPTYYNNMIDTEPGRFSEPGDTVSCRYRLLGRTVEGTITLVEWVAPQRIKLRGELKGLPPVEHEWTYTDSDGGTTVSVHMETPEVESWRDRVLDRFVIPRQLEKDLRRSLDNIEDLVAVGLS